jgi:hypothetical protein
MVTGINTGAGGWDFAVFGFGQRLRADDEEHTRQVGDAGSGGLGDANGLADVALKDAPAGSLAVLQDPVECSIHVFHVQPLGFRQRMAGEAAGPDLPPP